MVVLVTVMGCCMYGALARRAADGADLVPAVESRRMPSSMILSSAVRCAPGTRRSCVRPSVRLVSVHVCARRPSAPRSPRERARLLSTSTWLGVAWGVVRSVHAAHAPHRIAPHRIQDSRTPGGRPSSLPLVLASRRGGLGARGCARVRAGVTGSGRGVAVEARGARRTGGLLTAAHLCAWTRACGGWSGQGHAVEIASARGGGGRSAGRMRMIRRMLLLLLCVSRAGRRRAKDSGDGTAWKGGAVQGGACGDSEGRNWVCGWTSGGARTGGGGFEKNSEGSRNAGDRRVIVGLLACEAVRSEVM